MYFIGIPFVRVQPQTLSLYIRLPASFPYGIRCLGIGNFTHLPFQPSIMCGHCGTKVFFYKVHVHFRHVRHGVDIMSRRARSFYTFLYKVLSISTKLYVCCIVFQFKNVLQFQQSSYLAHLFHSVPNTTCELFHRCCKMVFFRMHQFDQLPPPNGKFVPV